MFICILRQTAGQESLKLARLLEKNTYKHEAHHRHLQFTNRALENGWYPKFLRFKPPENHLTFKHIMERTSKHCMKARISICHNQINTINKRIKNTSQELASRLPNNTFQSLTKFLKSRAESIRNTINARHNNKHENMKKGHPSTTIDKSNLVIYRRNPLPKPNALYYRKVRNSSQVLQQFHTKTLLPNSKLPLYISLTNQRTPYEQLYCLYFGSSSNPTAQKHQCRRKKDSQ